jgi:hypothetical protein
MVVVVAAQKGTLLKKNDGKQLHQNCKQKSSTSPHHYTMP